MPVGLNFQSGMLDDYGNPDGLTIKGRSPGRNPDFFDTLNKSGSFLESAGRSFKDIFGTLKGNSGPDTIIYQQAPIPKEKSRDNKLVLWILGILGVFAGLYLLRK
jgi:hypothetical protein